MRATTCRRQLADDLRRFLADDRLRLSGVGLGTSRQVVAATSIGHLGRGHVRRRDLVVLLASTLLLVAAF